MKLWSLEILQLPYNSRAAPGKMKLRNRWVPTAKPERRPQLPTGWRESWPCYQHHFDKIKNRNWNKYIDFEPERLCSISLYLFLRAFKTVINYFEANFYIQYLKIILFSFYFFLWMKSLFSVLRLWTKRS